MESMRATWTDSRLDALNERVDHLGTDIRELRGEFGALQRTIIQIGVALVGALVGIIVAILGVIATQL
jgi:hypothetical protein